MRPHLASWLALLFVLAGCDAGTDVPEPPVVPDPPVVPGLVVRSPRDTTLILPSSPAAGGVNTLRINLARVFTHPKGVPITSYNIWQDSSAQVQLGRLDSTLLVISYWGATATVNVRANAADGLQGVASFRVTYVVLDRFEVPARPTTTAYEGQLTTVPLAEVIRHLDGQPLQFAVHPSTPGWLGATFGLGVAFGEGTTLRLRPTASGAGVVVIDANDRGLHKLVSVPVRVLASPGRTCDEVLPGAFDPLPLRTGQTWAFALTMRAHSSFAGIEFRSSYTTGTVDWAVESASCTGGTVTAMLSERQTSVVLDTLIRGVTEPRTKTGSRRNVDETTRHEVTFSRNGPFPKVGGFVGATYGGHGEDPIPFFIPPSGLAEGRSFGRSYGTWRARADVAGLQFWEVQYLDNNNGNPGSRLLRLERQR